MAFGKRDISAESARPRSGGWNAEHVPTQTIFSRLHDEETHQKFNRMATRWGLALFGLVMLFGLAMTLLTVFVMPNMGLSSAFHILGFMKNNESALNWVGMGVGFALLAAFFAIFVMRSIATVTRPTRSTDANQVFRRNPQIWFWGLIAGFVIFFVHTGTTLDDMLKPEFWSFAMADTFVSNANGQGSTPDAPNVMVLLEHLILPLMAAHLIGLGYERWLADARGGPDAR